jgi:hypothetical protein
VAELNYEWVFNNGWDYVDLDGLWSIWAPWTWGDATPEGHSPWDWNNPQNNQRDFWNPCHWSDGLFATLDSLNPFGNWFANNEFYDPNGRGIWWSKGIGGVSGAILPVGAITKWGGSLWRTVIGNGDDILKFGPKTTANPNIGGLVEKLGESASRAPSWRIGANKSASKITNQMQQRGWTADQITEAIAKGKQFPAPNMVKQGNSATRFVHPTTGRSVVMDNVTKEVIHVGGDGFLY